MQRECVGKKLPTALKEHHRVYLGKYENACILKNLKSYSKHPRRNVDTKKR